MPKAGDLTTKVLTTVMVRCWSDPDNDVLVKSYSVYQAADDARGEHPGYAYYDAVRVLGDPVDAECLSEGDDLVDIVEVG